MQSTAPEIPGPPTARTRIHTRSHHRTIVIDPVYAAQAQQQQTAHNDASLVQMMGNLNTCRKSVNAATKPEPDVVSGMIQGTGTGGVNTHVQIASATCGNTAIHAEIAPPRPGASAATQQVAAPSTVTEGAINSADPAQVASDHGKGARVQQGKLGVETTTSEAAKFAAKFTKGDVLGKGAYGLVHLCTMKADLRKTMFAVKTVSIKDGRWQRAFVLAEIQIWKKLSQNGGSRFVLPLLEVFDCGKSNYIIYTYVYVYECMSV